MEPTRLMQYDGQEIQQTDLDIQGRTAALADDHVLAEILRLQPYDGTTYQKAIVPFGMRGKTSIAGIATNNGTVSTSFNTDGSVHIRPFRAIVGSRNQYFNPPANVPGVGTDNVTDSDGLASWRDIRSGVYVGVSSAALQGSITLAPNSSGSARWDLIYATITVDQGQNTIARRVKDPSTAALSVQNVSQYFTSPVTVSAVTGTPGTPAARPTLPADNPASGIFNIALAYVRVPNGFGAATQVSPKDVVATTSTGALFQRPQGGVRVCSGNNDANAAFTTSSGPFYYDPTSAGSRPGPFLPPDWLGREEFVCEIDCTSGTPGNWSHQSGSVVDDTIDWRFRLTEAKAYVASAGSALKFPNDPTASGLAPVVFPVPGGPSGAPTIQGSQTLHNDDLCVAGDPTILFVTNAINSAVQAGSTSGLYVDATTGKLLFFNNGTSPLAKLLVWIKATGQLPNP